MTETTKRFYKFLDSAYLENLLAGEIIIGSANYYRMLECITDDDTIGDKSEAVAHTKSGSFDIDFSNLSHEDRKIEEDLLKNLGIEVNNVGSITVSDNRFTTRYPCLIYSLFGTTDQPEIKEFPNYDACVEILDLNLLANALVSSGELFTLEGKCLGAVSELFSEVYTGPVEYKSNSQNYRDGRLQASPFIKPKKYRYQKEIRVVFGRPKIPQSDHFIIKCGDAAQYLRTHYVREVPAPAPAPAPADVVENHINTTALEFLTIYFRLKEIESGKSALRDITLNLNRFSTHLTDTSLRDVFELELLSQEEKNLEVSQLQRKILTCYWNIRKHIKISERIDNEIQSNRPMNSFHLNSDLAEFIAMNYSFFQNLDGSILPPIDSNPS